MSYEVEFEGRTISQAVANACQHLDIKEESLNYTVLTKGSTGIFGLVGAKKARIRAFLKDKADRMDPVFQKAENTQTAGDPLRKNGGSPSPAASAGHLALVRIIEDITETTRVLVKQDGNRIFYDIDAGGKAGVLIGKRGQTLEAMQYLVEKIVNRNSQERLRVSLDVAGYLARKRQKLESLAARTAQKAQKSGRPVTLGQLNAHDRRIVHLCLKNDSLVMTKSMGKGTLRKLVVMPKKRPSGPKKPS